MGGQLAVPVLGARVLDGQRNTRRPVNQCHGCRYLVDVLASWSSGTRKDFFELFRAQAKTSHAFGCGWIRAKHAGS